MDREPPWPPPEFGLLAKSMAGRPSSRASCFVVASSLQNILFAIKQTFWWVTIGETLIFTKKIMACTFLPPSLSPFYQLIERKIFPPKSLDYLHRAGV
jgi:hypothetical protein